MSENIIEKIFQPSARAKVWRFFALIIILVFIGGLVDAPSYYNKSVDWVSDKTGNVIKLPKTKEIPFRLGLDLQGGSHLVYSADMSGIEVADRADSLAGVRDVIEKRVNKFGVSEPLVQTSISGGEHRVIVELAGIKDVSKAIEMIGETPLLEFKELGEENVGVTDEEEAMMNKYNEDIEKQVAELEERIANGDDFVQLAGEYAAGQELKEKNGDLGWITKNTMVNAYDVVKDYGLGQVSEKGIFRDGIYEFYKLEDKRVKRNMFDDSEVKEVNASHLLICYKDSEKCDSEISKEEAYAKIKEIKAKATPANFASLVKEYSTEPGAAEREGDLGWFEKEMMVGPFSDTVFPQEVGTISYVVETKFGYHLIYKKDERSVEEYKVRAVYFRTITEKDILANKDNWKNTDLTGEHLEKAVVQFNPNDNSPEVGLQFNSEGAKLFAEITGRNVGKRVAIFLDGNLVNDPTVNEKITGGMASISGRYNIKQAKDLARKLNAGALPVSINLINQQTVGATLGQDSMNASMKAGVIGLLLVALFMVLYYRIPGILAVISLAIYGILVLAIFKMWPVTLTLSGLAGFILSVGMAVDANVLIFERLKEEVKEGNPLSIAVENAFNRAWSSIRDGNVSTLITCFILIQFSTSIVKGFAITLSLGVLVSMFSAIVITKTFLQLIAGDWLEKRKWLIGVSK